MLPDARRVRAASLVLLAALALPAAAFTPGQEAYVRGAQAWLADDFPTTVARMRAAIQEDPREGLQKFQYKGLNREDYLPQLYLGLALEKQGDRDGALAALRESRRQGVSLSGPAYRRLLERALQRLEPPPPTPVPTAAPAVPTARPAPTAAPPPTAVAAAPTHAPAAAATAVPAAGRPTARPVPDQTPPPPTPYPTAAPPPTPGADALALNAIVKQGIRLYFSGDYDGALRALEPVRTIRPAARLFSAYALASKAVLASPPDPELRRRALSEFASARAEGARPLPGALLSRPVREVLGLP